MEELNEMIRDYLVAQDTDYAIMINGDYHRKVRTFWCLCPFCKCLEG